MYKFGTIVLIPFPFTDLTSAKLRPAVIISKTNAKNDDIIVSFISSKLPKKLETSHYLVRQQDQDFNQTGLKTDSIIRFDKIATLSKKLILGELGSLSSYIINKAKVSFNAAFGF